VGVYLDGALEWGAVEEILRDAYRRVAPKRLLAQLAAVE
jgi:hypothetical protein